MCWSTVFGNFKNRAWRYVACIIASCVWCFLCLAVFLRCCFDNSTPVVYVLPKQYFGLIVIDTRSASRDDIKFVNGHYLVTIPASGIFETKTDKPFSSWHLSRASYEDGTPLLMGDEINDANDNIVRLWFLFGRGDGTLWLFIGTYAEKNDMFELQTDWKLGKYVDPFPH